MSLIFIILSETFISYSTFIQFSRDFFSLQDYVKFSLYANICECVWCIYCFKSHWESADCLLPLSFFHLFVSFDICSLYSPLETLEFHSQWTENCRLEWKRPRAHSNYFSVFVLGGNRNEVPTYRQHTATTATEGGVGGHQSTHCHVQTSEGLADSSSQPASSHPG